jgi:hypothetical protein
MENETILYQNDVLACHLEVKIHEDSVWLNRKQMSALFDRDIKTIGKHINNSLKEELNGISVVANIAQLHQMERATILHIISFKLIFGALPMKNNCLFHFFICPKFLFFV